MNNKISFKTFGLINIFSVMHINILSLAKELEINKRKFHKKAFAKKKLQLQSYKNLWLLITYDLLFISKFINYF